MCVTGSARSTSASVNCSARKPGTFDKACGKPAAWCRITGGKDGAGVTGRGSGTIG